MALSSCTLFQINFTDKNAVLMSLFESLSKCLSNSRSFWMLSYSMLWQVDEVGFLGACAFGLV